MKQKDRLSAEPERLPAAAGSQFTNILKRRITVRLVFVICTMAIVSGCSDPGPKLVQGDARAKSYPLDSIDMDPQRTMPFDPTQPYRLRFGRGSGIDGLDTVAIYEKGQVVLYRSKEQWDGGVIRHSWETATSSIDAETVRKIGELIRDCDLLGMNRAYHADVADGSQWVFWLVQGDHQKHIIFDNFFPEAIQDFAVGLDRDLKAGGVDVVEWKPVPAEEAGEHDKDLWESAEN
jgi:hypothetical protein